MGGVGGSPHLTFWSFSAIHPLILGRIGGWLINCILIGYLREADERVIKLNVYGDEWMALQSKHTEKCHSPSLKKQKFCFGRWQALASAKFFVLKVTFLSYCKFTLGFDGCSTISFEHVWLVCAEKRRIGHFFLGLFIWHFSKSQRWPQKYESYSSGKHGNTAKVKQTKKQTDL